MWKRLKVYRAIKRQIYQCANKKVDNHLWKVPRTLYDVQMKISRAFLTSLENEAVRYKLKRSRWTIKRDQRSFSRPYKIKEEGGQIVAFRGKRREGEGMGWEGERKVEEEWEGERKGEEE